MVKISFWVFRYRTLPPQWNRGNGEKSTVVPWGWGYSGDRANALGNTPVEMWNSTFKYRSLAQWSWKLNIIIAAQTLKLIVCARKGQRTSNRANLSFVKLSVSVNTTAAGVGWAVGDGDWNCGDGVVWTIRGDGVKRFGRHLKDR